MTLKTFIQHLPSSAVVRFHLGFWLMNRMHGLKRKLIYKLCFYALMTMSSGPPDLSRPWARVCLRWVRHGPGSIWLWRRKCFPNTLKSCSQTRSCSGQTLLIINCRQVYSVCPKRWLTSFPIFPLTGICINPMHSCSLRKKGSSFCSTCSLWTLWTTSVLHTSSPPSVRTVSVNNLKPPKPNFLRLIRTMPSYLPQSDV